LHVQRVEPRRVHLLSNRMRMFKAIWLWCLLALLSSFRTPAALQFDLLPGYEGTIHESAWFPITCEIFNDGPSFNAIIEISGGTFGTEQVRQVPVELPTSTRKRIVIPMFASDVARYGSSQTWNAKLLDANGKAIRGLDTRSSQTKMVTIESIVLGALPRNFGGSPTFPDMKNNRPELKPEVARMTIDQFPDNPLTLEGLNVFYLSSEKAPELKVNQVTALLAWVRAGGHLIVSTEQISDIAGTPWLKQFLPMELTDSRNIKLDQDVINWITGQSYDDPRQPGRRTRRIVQPTGNTYTDLPVDLSFNNAELPVGTGQLRDGRIVFGPTATPFCVQAPRGRGKVTLLTFSPEREPFRSWKARGHFWAKLSGIPGELFTSTENAGWGGLSVDGVFGALIDSRQIKKLPVTWLLLLLVVYLVVIGPFDQWWLKKIGRQMLTWITFPTYVVLFSLLIYFIGYKLRAGETEWNELNIVDVLPRVDKVDLRGRTYVSIYSSGNATYPITGQKGHAALRPESSDFRGGPKNDRLKVVQQGNSFKAEVFVPVWTSLLYANEWFKTNDTPFIASVSEVGSEYQLEIENLLNRPLTELRVVVGQNLHEVEAIPANSKKIIRLSAAKGVNIRQFVRENGAYFQRAVDVRRSPVGDTSGGHLENRSVVAVTASFISYLDEQPGRVFLAPPGLDLTAQIERGDAAIFAWVPNFSFSEKINDFQPPRFKQDTLLRLTVPVH
jgi:hypothetical protein